MKTEKDELTLRQLHQKSKKLHKDVVINGTGYGYRIELQDRK